MGTSGKETAQEGQGLGEEGTVCCCGCRRRAASFSFVETGDRRMVQRVESFALEYVGTRCGQRGCASANDLPDRHKAGPRHKGWSQLSGWSCRGWQGRPTSSSARGSLTPPDTPGRAFSLIGLGTNGLGSRSSDPGNAVCVHA